MYYICTIVYKFNNLKHAFPRQDESPLVKVTPDDSVKTSRSLEPMNDDREGYLDHPTRGRVNTYIFEVSNSVRSRLFNINTGVYTNSILMTAISLSKVHKNF